MEVATVNDQISILELGDWLRTQETVGFALWDDNRMGFANKNAAWLVELPPSVALWKVRAAMLKGLLTGREGPLLVTRSIRSVLPKLLDVIFGTYEPGMHTPERRAIAEHFVGDLMLLEYCSGYAVCSQAAFSTPAQDALDCAVIEPQLTVDLGEYYTSVSLPLARHIALQPPDGEGRRWQVKYDHLFLRVLASLTGDPTLYRLFVDTPDEDPVDHLANELGIPHVEVLPFLAWVVLDQDEGVLYRLGDIGPLPAEPEQLVRDVLDKKLPAIRAWCALESTVYREQQRSETRYGRWTEYPSPVSECFRQRVFGTVQDIIEVALVSLIGEGAQDAHDVSNRWWERAILQGHDDGDMLATVGDVHIPLEHKLKVLCQLGYPIAHLGRSGITLNPQTYVETED